MTDLSLQIAFSIGFLAIAILTDYNQLKPNRKDMLHIVFPANAFAILVAIFIAVLQQQILFIFSAVLLKPFFFQAFRNYYKTNNDTSALEASE